MYVYRMAHFVNECVGIEVIKMLSIFIFRIFLRTKMHLEASSESNFKRRKTINTINTTAWSFSRFYRYRIDNVGHSRTVDTRIWTNSLHYVSTWSIRSRNAQIIERIAGSCNCSCSWKYGFCWNGSTVINGKKFSEIRVSNCAITFSFNLMLFELPDCIK